MWQAIAHHDRMTQAVTLASALLRTAVSIQAALAASMLASLAIERKEVKLKYLPVISTARTNISGPFTLGWYMRPQRKKLLLPFLTAVLCLTSLTLQFSSTILVSDVRQGWILGTLSASEVKAGYNGSETQSEAFPDAVSPIRWQMKLQQYPTFAEFHGNDAIQGIDGISDTGTTIRAFLPFADASTRSSISDYRGPATVVDVRTVCMRPNLKAQWKRSTSEYYIVSAADGILPSFAGNISVPAAYNIRPADLPDTMSWRISGQLYESGFDCTIPYGIGIVSSQDSSRLYHSDDWSISLCHLTSGAGLLVSEFYDRSQYSLSSAYTGDSYLVVNQTLDSNGLSFLGLFDSPPVRNTTDGEWLHLFFDVILNDNHNVHTEARVSLSLCSTAVDGILTNISASASNNRTEPSPNVINDILTFADVRRQLGQDHSLSPYDRGILELQKDGWILRRGEGAKFYNEIDYISSAVKMVATNQNESDASIGFTTGIGFSLYNNIYADSNIAILFQEILKTGGGISFALQSITSVLVSMVYYDQVPLFDQVFPANSTFLEQRQIPGGQSNYLAAPAGFRPGLLTVLCVLAAHCVTVSIIVWLFFSSKSSHNTISVTSANKHEKPQLCPPYIIRGRPSLKCKASQSMSILRTPLSPTIRMLTDGFEKTATTTKI